MMKRMNRVVMIDIEMQDGISEEAIKTFFEEAIEHAITSPVGRQLGDAPVSFQVVEVT